MFDNIYMGVLIFLAVFGIAAIVYAVLMKVLTPPSKPAYYIVLKLTRDSDPLDQLSCAVEKRNLLGENARCVIIAVDCGLDENIRDTLENLYGRTPGVRFSDCRECFEQLISS